MENQSGDVENARGSGAFGCNIIGLIVLLIVLVAFGAAAWVNMPTAAPDPVDTGVPPTAPSPS